MFFIYYNFKNVTFSNFEHNLSDKYISYVEQLFQKMHLELYIFCHNRPIRERETTFTLVKTDRYVETVRSECSCE